MLRRVQWREAREKEPGPVRESKLPFESDEHVAPAAMATHIVKED